MTSAKEFQGKSLDDAINSACDFFGVERAKLEVEIINDSKTGIFGLVNVRQAKIRARKVDTPSLLEKIKNPLEKDNKKKEAKGSVDKGKEPKELKENKDSKKDQAFKKDKPVKYQKQQEKTVSEKNSLEKKEDKSSKPKIQEKTKKSETENKASGAQTRAVKEPTNQAKPENKNRKEDKDSAPSSPKGRELESSKAEDLQDDRNEMQVGAGSRKRSQRGPRPKHDKPEYIEYEPLKAVDLKAIPEDDLVDLVYEVVEKIVLPISDQAEIEVDLDDDHIRVKVECGDDAGILVGREGQTLSAVQYIVSRIIGNRLGGTVKIHIDTANYRENQDERLTQLALDLAERVRANGKTQSTRPLTAYQRRIVHLALEGDDSIQTASRGEGRQRRVLIHQSRRPSEEEQVDEI